MAETYKHLHSVLHQPPLPKTVNVGELPSQSYGLNFPNQKPCPERTKPGVYQDQIFAPIPPGGGTSLHTYRVPVRPEEYSMHYGVQPSQLYHLPPGHHQRQGLEDSEIVTHHTGQKVHYKYKPEYGVYTYEGLVFPQHEKDRTPDEEQTMRYVRRVDRSDYYDAPVPQTNLPATQVQPATPYELHGARFYKPLPKQTDGPMTHTAPTDKKPSLGNAAYNQTVYVN